MIEFFKQYLPYYSNYKRKFTYVIIGIILVSIGTSGSAYAIKPLLDEVFVNKDIEMLQLMPLVIILLYLAKGIGRYLQTYYISFIGQDIIRIVRDKLLTHILYLDLDFFSSKHGGELVSRITNDINRIQSAISTQVARIIQDALTIVALVVVVVYQSPQLAFFGLIVLPLALYPLSLLAKKMKKISFSSQSKNSDLLSCLNEIFNNIEIVKASSAENSEAKKFKEINLDFFKINIKSVKTNALVSPVMEILGAIAIAIVIIIGGYQVIDGDLTVGTFFSFMAALFMLYTPIKSISSQYNKLQDALTANERVNELFAKKSDIVSGNEIFPNNINEISFEDIVLEFEDKRALDKVSLKVKKGETIALVGDSGGGKSSLVNALMKFYQLKSGTIKINNQEIDNFTLESLRNAISIVTQRVYIFNDTVAKNVAYGQPYNEEKVHEALKQAYAFDFVSTLEHGIMTILDEFGTNLSGGQRQRIAIARALYKSPKILILDEATSALDNKSESMITNILEKVSTNKITFVIAHRLSTVKNADKIAVFKEGKIVCIDSEKILNKSCDEYRRLSQGTLL
ncbi:MAG: ABC transporter ATP-binding protein [Campylobacterota bacterium]|nr:ABC transporter ATP-binding protein [Campylobacterota bacterium]